MTGKGHVSFVQAAARRGAVVAAAMLFAASTFIPATPAFAHGDLTVSQGTSISVRVDTPINSTDARPGDEFRAVVLTPVTVSGEPAIPDGTIITGQVSDVVANRSFGRSSGVVVRVDRMQSPLGGTISLNGNLSDQAGNPFITVDNLPRGTRLQLVVTRSFVVNEAFYMDDTPGGGGVGGGDDVLSGPETIRQVQTALRDLGYYTGRIDGQLNAPTRSAIAVFQRDQRLGQTGFLDRETLDRLGLISQSGGEVNAVNVISADAAIHPGNQLHIRVVTQGANGLTLFEDHFRQRDTVHVYVRGFRTTSGPRATGEINVVLRPEDWTGVNRIVVHSAGNDIVIRATDVTAGATPLTVQEAAALEARITRLLQQYAGTLGVRYNAFTGQLVFSSTLNYRENETELLFALNSAASTAKLYTQLLRTSTDAQALQGATDVYVAQANAVERAISRTKSGRATSVIAGWQALRDQFQRLDEASSNEFQGTPAYR